MAINPANGGRPAKDNKEIAIIMATKDTGGPEEGDTGPNAVEMGKLENEQVKVTKDHFAKLAELNAKAKADNKKDDIAETTTWTWQG